MESNKIGFALYDLDLDDFIYKQSYHTRHRTINPHFGNEPFQFCFLMECGPKLAELTSVIFLESEFMFFIFLLHGRAHCVTAHPL